MLTMRRLSLGKGYRYLMESIATGDGREQQSSPLTRYYAESGTPPGVFLGSGLAVLGGLAGVEKGSQVSETHLYRMLGEVTDPVTGEPLGRAANTQSVIPGESAWERLSRRPHRRSDGHPSDRRPRPRKERWRTVRRPAVAGFDLTFSPSKSVSTVWALADQGTQAIIFECHRRAIDYVLTYAEEHVFHSRSGTNGVVQEDIVGVVAASFTHYDTRAGDPQLHDHLVVWNRAKSKSDGQWRTLDSRGLYKSVVTLGVMHEGVLSDLLTEALGVGWDQQSTRGGMVKTELAGVPEALMREFSQRREMIEEWRDGLVARFVTEHGREPSPVELMRLNQEANLATRKDKQHRSLAEMTDDWRARAVEYVGDDITAWVSTLRDRNDLPVLHADDLADDILADTASVACQKVAERHSTFSRSNVLAEVHRQLQGVRFASPHDRVAVAERTADIALRAAIQGDSVGAASCPGALQAGRRHVDGFARPTTGSTRPPPCWMQSPGCSQQDGVPAGRLSLSPPWPPWRTGTCPDGTTRCPQTRLSPSRRSRPAGDIWTCSSARPGPGSRPRWRVSRRRGKPSTGWAR